jgi:hypothetical protein
VMIHLKSQNGLFCLPSAGEQSRPRKAVPLLVRTVSVLVLLGISARPALSQATLDLSSAAGGVVIAGTNPSFSSGFGNVNGLGVGTPTAGVSLLTSGVSGGVLYWTSYNILISSLVGNHTATVSAYVSTNFARPSILILWSCYPSSSCSTAANYTTISTSPAAPTPIVPSPGVANGTVTASLGLFVANTNGPGASSGSDSATITFVATDIKNNKTSSVTLGLNNPSENLQTAVQLLLTTAPGGVAVSPGADFAISFGNVNGLGIGPAAGLSVVPSSGGVIYTTPYLAQPSFSSFVSTTGSVKVYVSMDFVHPAILQLEDAAASSGPFVAISKSSGAPSSLTTNAASGLSLTRYLGLFVSNANGPTAFTGSDSATLTYTLTVP